MEKKHILKMEKGDKKVVIGTDNFSELSQQDWVRGFLKSLQDKEVSVADVEETHSSQRREAKEVETESPSEEPSVDEDFKARFEQMVSEHNKLTEVVNNIGNDQNKIKNYLEEVMNQMRVGAQQQANQGQQQSSPSMGRSPQAQQPQQSQAQPQTQSRVPDSDFMGISPEDMTEDLWNDLTAKQQQAWMQEHNIG